MSMVEWYVRNLSMTVNEKIHHVNNDFDKKLEMAFFDNFLELIEEEYMTKTIAR